MSGPGANRHLTDEELSDLVDGRAGPDAAGHAAGCARCASNLDRWREAAARLAVSAPVPAGRRGEAVAAALAASGPRRAPGRRRPMMAGLAAAAVVLVAVAVGLSRLGGSGPARTTAGAASSATAPAGSSALSAPSAPADLGALSGPAAVAAAAARALGGPSASLAGPASSASAAGPTPATGAPSGRPSGSPSPAGSAPTAGSSYAASSGAMPASGAAAAPAGCQEAGPERPAPSARLLLQAVAVYRSIPARVYLYQVGSGREAVVVEDRTCSVLVEVPF